MIEIRIHGRGGQGGVTAAELLAVAAFKDGKFSQAFGAFGPERRGAPVQAFCRIDDEKFIQIRQQIYHPDLIIVLDPNLLQYVDVTEGAKKETKYIVNATKDPEIKGDVCWVNATEVAMEIVGKNIVNTAMLAALVKATKIVSMESLEQAIKERFGEKIATKNVELIKKTHEVCKV